MFYVVDIEFARRSISSDAVDDLLDELIDVHPAVSMTPQGWVSATITIPVESALQAAVLGSAVVERAARVVGLREPILHLDVLAEPERDAREGFPVVPDLVSTAEAAQLLGVSRQRVAQLIERGSLRATRIGARSLVLERSAVEAFVLAGKLASRRAQCDCCADLDQAEE